MTPLALTQWLRYVECGDEAILDRLIHEDAEFHSPAVYRPQHGRAKVCAYLVAAERMFSGTNFRYGAQWLGERSAVLEFAADLDGIHVNGVDVITWDGADKIVSFKVMVRPLRALQTVVPLMGSLLSGRGGRP